ncbi:MAG: DUF4290 domain-containing protein [Mangrovibacterium sp.]
MDYNSNREKLIMPEYGRNIQSMANHMLTIEDRAERNKAAQAIITVMGNMYPYLRDIADYRHKLWDHLAIISNYKLDIDSPYPTPSEESFTEPPTKVPYNTHRLKFRHYGSILEKLVATAADQEAGEKKEVLLKMLANHMKKCYLTWNKDIVDDDKIYEDLSILSEGKIQRNNIELAETRDIMNTKRKKIQRNTRHTNQTQRFKKRHNNNNQSTK